MSEEVFQAPNPVTTFGESSNPFAPPPTTSIRNNTADSTPAMTSSMTQKEAHKTAAAAPSTRFSSVTYSQWGPQTENSEWVSRQEFDKFKFETMRKIEEMAQEIAELKAKAN